MAGISSSSANQISKITSPRNKTTSSNTKINTVDSNQLKKQVENDEKFAQLLHTYELNKNNFSTEFDPIRNALLKNDNASAEDIKNAIKEAVSTELRKPIEIDPIDYFLERISYGSNSSATPQKTKHTDTKVKENDFDFSKIDLDEQKRILNEIEENNKKQTLNTEEQLWNQYQRVLTTRIDAETKQNSTSVLQPIKAEEHRVFNNSGNDNRCGYYGIASSVATLNVDVRVNVYDRLGLSNTEKLDLETKLTPLTHKTITEYHKILGDKLFKKRKELFQNEIGQNLKKMVTDNPEQKDTIEKADGNRNADTFINGDAIRIICEKIGLSVRFDMRGKLEDNQIRLLNNNNAHYYSVIPVERLPESARQAAA
jgi:hypothetical protein